MLFIHQNSKGYTIREEIIVEHGCFGIEIALSTDMEREVDGSKQDNSRWGISRMNTTKDVKAKDKKKDAEKIDTRLSQKWTSNVEKCGETNKTEHPHGSIQYSGKNCFCAKGANQNRDVING